MAVDETVKFKSTICCPIVGLTKSTKISTDESNPGSPSITVNVFLLSISSTTATILYYIIVQVVKYYSHEILAFIFGTLL